MQKDDHTSIKYLMKELDPAEAVLFEQKMMEDEELLQEVECMRRTLRHLEKLPVKNPPSELTEYIVRKACSCNSSSRLHHWKLHDERFSMTRYYAAAALILVGMGIGLLSYQYTDKEVATAKKGQSVSTAEIGNSKPLLKSENLQPLIKQEKIINLNRLSDEESAREESFDTTYHEPSSETDTFGPPLMHEEASSSGNVRLTGSQR